jgi:antitoxin component of MazEF toxin-antitoxin module
VITLPAALRRLARLWGCCAMPEIPADMLAQLNAAEEALAAAAQGDLESKDADDQAEAADARAAAKKDAAHQLHMTAAQKAGNAIAALRAHFNV